MLSNDLPFSNRNDVFEKHKGRSVSGYVMSLVESIFFLSTLSNKESNFKSLSEK